MKYYIVKLCKGSYDELSWSTLFITDMEYKAKWYCSKGNAILEKYKDHYHKFYEDDKHENWYHFYQRSEFVNGQFMFSEVEVRTEFIKLRT